MVNQIAQIADGLEEIDIQNPNYDLRTSAEQLWVNNEHFSNAMMELVFFVEGHEDREQNRPKVFRVIMANLMAASLPEEVRDVLENARKHMQAHVIGGDSLEIGINRFMDNLEQEIFALIASDPEGYAAAQKEVQERRYYLNQIAVYEESMESILESWEREGNSLNVEQVTGLYDIPKSLSILMRSVLFMMVSSEADPDCPENCPDTNLLRHDPREKRSAATALCRVFPNLPVHAARVYIDKMDWIYDQTPVRPIQR